MQEWMKEITIDDLDEKNREIADVIGIDNLLKFLECFGGTRLYINKLHDVTNVSRNRKIKQEYNGYNLKQLVKKYGLASESIRRIIRNEEK